MNYFLLFCFRYSITMAPKKRTRQSSFTHLSNLIGSGRDLLPSQLPTLRDILRYGLLLREQSDEDLRNYTGAGIAKDIYPKVLEKWERANSLFVTPVLNSRTTILNKIESSWEQAKNISLGRGTVGVKEAFTSKLDRLFDILNCKCNILFCSEFDCPGCQREAHINCLCSKEKKIPVNELAFIKGQRDKIGSFGPHQIGLPDLPEHNRLVKKQIRQEDQRKRIAKHKQVSDISLISSEITFNSDENDEEIVEGENENEANYEFPMEKQNEPSTSSQNTKYNTLEIPNIAMQSIRYGVSLRATAAIATSAFIDAGLITKDDQSLVIDHSKVKRAQEKIMLSLDQEFDEFCKKGGIECIFFDGRADLTKVLLEADNSDQQFPSIVKEQHYSVCSEPGGKYLYHFTPVKGGRREKPAEIIAEELVAFMKKKGIDRSLQAIGGDSTNVNTGWDGGIMHWIEVMLGRKLNWLVCALHTNELPLRHLITALDGKTLSNNKWAGDIGKMLDTATELEINPTFIKLSIGQPLIPLSDSIIMDLSTDQAYGYRITQSIRTGELSSNLALLEIGPVCHSRWLTTANRLCRIWISKHGLQGKNLRNIRLIVEFIVGVYYSCWFNIKVKQSWVEGPRHILFQLQQVKSQQKPVVDVVLPVIQRSAWYAFSEMIIQTLLSSNDREERKSGVQKIIDLRRENEVGDISVRPRKTPFININATSLLQLIDWSVDVYEPPLTCTLTTTEIKKFIDAPMKVPQWPCHGQSIERCVKQVTEAAGKVYSHEKREGYIRGQEASRQLMNKNESKQDLMKLVV